MWDDAIHAYYLNTRYYGPEMVRFISADSILTDEQIPLESNVYAYCLSNPINNKDDEGLSSQTALDSNVNTHNFADDFGAIGAAGVGGAAAYGIYETYQFNIDILYLFFDNLVSAKGLIEAAEKKI